MPLAVPRLVRVAGRRPVGAAAGPPLDPPQLVIDQRLRPEQPEERLVDGEVSNRHRFIDAAKALYIKYCQFQKKLGNTDQSDKWRDLESELITIMGQTYTGDEQRYKGERLKSYKKRLNWFPEFDETIWFKEAIETDVNGLVDKSNGALNEFTLFRDKYYWNVDIDREKTNWYRFQEAVKEHERIGIQLLSEQFKVMGYDLAVV